MINNISIDYKLIYYILKLIENDLPTNSKQAIRHCRFI